jgi:hypothetical protein
MGNSPSLFDETVDYGKTMPLGQLYPKSLGGYDKVSLKKAIFERRLSPFYKGTETEEEFREEFSKIRFVPLQDKRKSSSVFESFSSLGRNRNSVTESLVSLSHLSVADLTDQPMECPICFLVFDP